MTIAVLVVAPSALREKAVRWADAGLVGDSFWVLDDDAVGTDHDRPNALAAIHIKDGSASAPRELFDSMSDEAELSEVRVAWVRDQGQDMTSGMKRLETLLRPMLPSQRVTWIDVVIPTRRTDDALTPLPGQWIQLRIHPEDRSAPDVTDAGWDLDRDVPLHGVLVSVGLLGGTLTAIPWGTLTAHSAFDFRTFSRVVLGANDARTEARSFLGRRLPEASVGAFHTERFLELDEWLSPGHVKDALDFLLASDSACLSYDCPASSEFDVHPTLTWSKHVGLFLRFIRFGVDVLVGKNEKPEPPKPSRFESEDLGYGIEQDVSSRERTHLPDFDRLDAEAAARNRTYLDDRRRQLSSNPPSPTPQIWRTTIRLATCLNDGGAAPDGWDPMDHEGLRPALRAPWIQPSPQVPVSSTFLELSRARTPSIARLAAAHAADRRPVPLAAPRSDSRVVAAAHAIATEGNAADAERLRQQVELLDPPEGQEQPVSLLDRLAGTILGGGIRARLDADRWEEFATGSMPDDAINWSAERKAFRRRALRGLLASLVVGVLVGIVLSSLGSSARWWITLTSAVVVAVGALAWALYKFFLFYSAFLERGRRRLEARRIWAARAEQAMEEAARLGVARRICDAWVDVLGSLFPAEEVHGATDDRSMPTTAPKCLAIAVASYEPDEMISWLAEKGAQPGWRSRALEAIAARALDLPAADALKILAEDVGLPGGQLDGLRDHASEIWPGYSVDLHDQVSSGVAVKMIASSQRAVQILSPAARAGQTPLLGAFVEEPWPATQADDSSEWDQSHSVDVRGTLAAPDVVQLAADALLVSTRMQLRRSQIPEAQQDPVPVDESGPDGTF